MARTFVRRIGASLLVVGLGLGSLPVARAADADSDIESEAPGPSPLRLGFTAGDVRFWRPGTESWVPAQANIPLAPGDQLTTDRLGNIEVQTGPDSFVRLWGDSRLALIGHDEDVLRLGVTNGYLGLDLRTVAPGTRVHVDTPHAAITVGQAGYYRIDVLADRTAVSARRGGRATVTAHGHTASVASDHQIVAGASAGPLEPTTAPATDAWDRWSIERTDTLLTAESARYVAPGVYGAADLDRNGTWREEPAYGPVWEPRGVAAGWVPYSTGTWMSDPVYGWTWVDAAPWGWAPYHYGRWVFVNGGWAWAPGPRVVRPVYAPALVAFFGPPQPVGRPFVSWVALGWGEPLIPWWGRAGFVGRPWYAGWSGPRHGHRHGLHARALDYRNAGVRNAVVGMHRDRFGRERVERARISSVDVNRLQPVRDPRPDRDALGREPQRPGIETPTERLRDRTSTRPGSTDSAERERATGRAEREESERPRERQTPAEADAREQPRLRAVPPRDDADGRRAPRVDRSPRQTPSAQHWRRTGDARMGGMQRDRNVPVNGRGDSPSRGRR
jgi:hypothetical protein